MGLWSDARDEDREDPELLFSYEGVGELARRRLLRDFANAHANASFQSIHRHFVAGLELQEIGRHLRCTRSEQEQSRRSMDSLGFVAIHR